MPVCHVKVSSCSFRKSRICGERRSVVLNTSLSLGTLGHRVNEEKLSLLLTFQLIQLDINLSRSTVGILLLVFPKIYNESETLVIKDCKLDCSM